MVVRSSELKIWLLWQARHDDSRRGRTSDSNACTESLAPATSATAKVATVVNLECAMPMAALRSGTPFGSPSIRRREAYNNACLCDSDGGGPKAEPEEGDVAERATCPGRVVRKAGF